MTVIKEKFYKQAESNGATHCIHFNWDYKYRPWQTCAKDYVENDIICQCSVFCGGKCANFERGRG